MIRLLVLATVVAGCSKKSESPPPPEVEPAKPVAAEDPVIAQAEQLATDVCACSNQDCIEKVMRAAEKAFKPNAADPKLRDRLASVAIKIQSCIAKLPPIVAQPKPPPDPADELPKRAVETSTDQLILDTKTWVIANAPDVVVQQVRAAYVRKDGTLDPTYGELTVEYGVPEHATEVIDDPKRPTGAPIPTADIKRDRCPRFSFAKGTWRLFQSSCTRRDGIKGPRCGPTEMWKRALAAGAPADAVAIVRQDTYNRGSWYFSINDPLRKVTFTKTFADDCEVRVEGMR